MAILSNIEPTTVFSYFEELCSIPHGSTNTKQISDYLVDFAKVKNLRYIQDDSNNVIIFKLGTAGYENSPAIILQGHMDMVAVKDDGVEMDMEQEGPRLQVSEGIISAEGTSLGGDDGIAVSFALAILASDDIPHPPIEAVFTVDEEIGMLGAAALDCTPLTARTMLNIDSEEEGILTCSCAGGATVECTIPCDFASCDDFAQSLVISITNVSGGHSGVEIHKQSANANVLLARFLQALDTPFALANISGGEKDNAIPTWATATILTNDAASVRALAKTYTTIYQNEFAYTDPSVTVDVTDAENIPAALTSSDTQKFMAYMNALPSGIQRYCAEPAGLVQTSLNMGILRSLESGIRLTFSVRSSVASEKENLIQIITGLTEVLAGGSVSISGDYPAWEYKKSSRLRELMVDVFTKQYGHPPKVEAVHAGLECGIFSAKLPGLDCISYGPNLNDIHTTKETMEIASVQRVWEYTLRVLEALR